VMAAKRPSMDEYFLELARVVGLRSTCLRRKFGAVIVKDGVVLSSGYNGAARKVRDCLEVGLCLKEAVGAPHGEGYDVCPAVHAEANAIVNAARSGVSIVGGIMYLHGQDLQGRVVEGKPCTFCRRLLINSGIEKIVFKREDGSLGYYDIKEWVRDESLDHQRKIQQHTGKG
jgi:dCMP deaminase